MSKRIILATVTVLIFNTPAFTSPRCEDYIEKCVSTPYNGTPYNATDTSHVAPFCAAIFPPELGDGGKFGETTVCPAQVKDYIQKSELTYGSFKPTKEFCEALFIRTKDLKGNHLKCGDEY